MKIQGKFVLANLSEKSMMAAVPETQSIKELLREQIYRDEDQIHLVFALNHRHHVSERQQRCTNPTFVSI
ncbi:hypothetical protein [Ferrovum sp.]|uniref:hypothetical protein n=1 Tax=Ferrovum sp. TaxID=2609467 RepID=UPI00262F0DF1|nr:hypothetical protein [Ferrovum sp.]